MNNEYNFPLEMYSEPPQGPIKAPLDPLYENLAETFIDTVKTFLSPPDSVKMPSWGMFNSMVGGLRMKEFSIICGGTGVGKTAWLAKLSSELLKSNTPHYVMSVETGHIDFMRRVFCALTQKDWNTGVPIKREELAHEIAKVVKELSKPIIKFSKYENRVSTTQLLHDLEYMNEKYGCKVAIIDNLNFFLEVVRANDSIIEMDRVIHELIMFCKRTDMHIFMVMHPKKTESGKVLSEFDIKGSSTAVQEAQNVFLLNRPTKDDLEGLGLNPRDKSYRMLTVAKMRRMGKYVGSTIIYGDQFFNEFKAVT